MGRHQILTRMAREFPVVWMDPAREWRAILSELRTPRPKYHFAIDVPGIAVYRHSPLLPRIYRPRAIARLTERRRVGQAIRLLRNRGARRIVLSLWTRDGLDVLNASAPDVSTYHIRDEYSFSDVDAPPDPSEVELIRRVDQVFVASPGLLETKGRFARNPILIPNGVDYRAFADCHPEPEELARIPHPRIGYVGWFKDQLDGSLLIHLARSHPRWSFVFIGPERTTPATAPTLEIMRALPNIYLFGPKLPDVLPAYVQHLDVGLLPYRVTDYTKYIYPLKLHEYLAAGVPVVSSAIRTVLDFQNVVAVASTPEEWEAAIARAILPDAKSEERTEARRVVARAHDWDGIAERVTARLRTLLQS